MLHFPVLETPCQLRDNLIFLRVTLKEFIMWIHLLFSNFFIKHVNSAIFQFVCVCVCICVCVYKHKHTCRHTYLYNHKTTLTPLHRLLYCMIKGLLENHREDNDSINDIVINGYLSWMRFPYESFLSQVRFKRQKQIFVLIKGSWGQHLQKVREGNRIG